MVDMGSLCVRMGSERGKGGVRPVGAGSAGLCPARPGRLPRAGPCVRRRQVLTYMVKDGRFKSMKNKTFKGHNTAGYACQVNTSPDGK
jgi:hypothetical protein